MSKGEIFWKISLIILGILALVVYGNKQTNESGARYSTFQACVRIYSVSDCVQLLGK